MKSLKKLLFFLSLFLIYFIFKEFIVLYSGVKGIHPYLGYLTLVIITAGIIYFLIIPVIKIMIIPKNMGPSRSRNEEQDLISRRITRFRKNPFLLEANFDFDEAESEAELYKHIIKTMEKECGRLRRHQVSQLFYSTTVIQNGFLDALLILAASINHVKEIFILFNGRVTNRDLWNIAKKIYYSAVIGGSEGVEYATEEVISKFATDGLKSIPFIDKILSSLADGFVNAALLTRISYITENYCKLTYVKQDRELYPSPKFIVESVRHITSDFMSRIFSTLRKMALKFAVDKGFDYALIAVNPIGYVLGKTIDRSERFDPGRKKQLKEHAKLVGNPLAYGIEKLLRSLKKR